jgi:uncharacterized membrane protein
MSNLIPDITTISIIFGLFLVVLHICFSKKITTLSTALPILLYSQSIIYGLIFVSYSLKLINPTYLVDNRWIIAFGGIALIWIGIENYKNDFFKK